MWRTSTMPQNPLLDAWTETATQHPFAALWTDATESWTEFWMAPDALSDETPDPWTDAMRPWLDPEVNPAADSIRPFHEAVNLWTGWALTGFGDDNPFLDSDTNPFVDPDASPFVDLPATPFSAFDATVDGLLPAADGPMLVDLWLDVVDAWLDLLGASDGDDQFTTVPIE